MTLADIGIPASVLAEIAPNPSPTSRALDRRNSRWPKKQGHKYARGHAVVVSGPLYSTGAARLPRAARSGPVPGW